MNTLGKALHISFKKNQVTYKVKALKTKAAPLRPISKNVAFKKFPTELLILCQNGLF